MYICSSYTYVCTCLCVLVYCACDFYTLHSFHNAEKTICMCMLVKFEFIEYVDDKAAARALNGNFDTTNESSVLGM